MPHRRDAVEAAVRASTRRVRELRQFRDSVVPAQVLELFHGWKIYDYLIYTRYRFLQRETRWKGLEDSLDECIDESVRTLDQMCFSSQYYMMMTVQVSDSASVSELQVRVDGVSATSRGRDAVDAAVRASTRRARAVCRDGVRATG